MKMFATWKNVAAAVAVPSVMATDYNVGAGQTHTNLSALKTAHGTFVNLDKIIFHDATDNSLTAAFGIASADSVITLSGTGTIGAASNIHFISTTSTPFTLAAATGSAITFSGFNITGNGAVLYNSNISSAITLGTAGSTGGSLIFTGNTASGTSGAISTSYYRNHRWRYEHVHQQQSQQRHENRAESAKVLEEFVGHLRTPISCGEL